MTAGVMAGPIRRVARERIERRDDVRLPAAWIDTCASSGVDGTSDSWLSHVDVAAAIPVARGPVLALLDGEGARAMGTLLAHAEAGERVYVLSAAGWDPRQGSPRLRSCPRVLLRRVPAIPVSGVITSAGAWLWLGERVGADGRWVLRLDAEQAEALRQLFLHQFWHRAVDEAWTGARPPVFRPAGARPFDVPAPAAAAPVQILAAGALLDLDGPGALIHRSGGEPPAGPLCRLWLPPGGSHHDRLTRLVRDGTEVLWADRGLPDVMIGAGAQRGAVLVPGAGGCLRIELNPGQAAAAAALLEQPGAWRFELDVRLGDHRVGSTRLQPGGAGAAHPIDPEQGIDLGCVDAEHLRSVAETAPASWPAPGPLALSVRYRWAAVPPRLPPGTEEDSLVQEWRRADEAWVARLAKVEDELRATERERGQLSQTFARLVGELLGLGRTEGRLRGERAILEAQKPSAAGTQGARDLLERLARLEEDAQRLRGNLEDAEHKARLDEAREAQEAAWRKRRDEAQRSLYDRRGSLAGARAQRATLASDLERTVEALKAADEDAKKDAKKDLKVQRKKLSDDVEQLDKRVRRLEQEVAELERQEQASFEFKPPLSPPKRWALGAVRFIPAPSSPRATSLVPDEALPTVGRLRSLRGQRYLVIETWEELTPGEVDATRLKARLVAPEDA